jgi:hypothetical protein
MDLRISLMMSRPVRKGKMTATTDMAQQARLVRNRHSAWEAPAPRKKDDIIFFN